MCRCVCSPLASHALTRLNCKPVHLPEHQFLFSIEVAFGDARRHLVLVIQLTLANARSGPQAAFQGFVNSDVSAISSEPERRLTDIVWFPCAKPYVDCSCPCVGEFLEPVGSGALDTLAIQQVATRVMSPIAKETEAQRKHLSLCTSLWAHRSEPGTWNGRRCIRIDESWGPVVIRFGGKGKAPPPLPAPATPPLALPHALHDDDDFAALPAQAHVEEAAHVVSDEEFEEEGEEENDNEEDEVYDDAEEYGDDDHDELSDHSEPNNDDDEVFASGVDMEPSAFDVIEARVGVKRVDNKVVDLEYDIPLGSLDFVHGLSLSVKGVCDHPDHQPTTTSCRKCQLWLKCESGVMDRYESILVWLKDGVSHTREEHLRTAAAVRARFRT